MVLGIIKIFGKFLKKIVLIFFLTPLFINGQQISKADKRSPDYLPDQQNDSTTKPKGILNILNTKGIDFGLNAALEGYYNFEGGISIGNAFASTLDANMSIDLQKLLNLRGGMFYADLEDHRGDNPSNTLLGDAQVFDKHNSAPFFQMLELWYQQKFFRDKLRIKIGKVDANSEYSVIDNGLEFINSTTQVSPTFFVFPTFPDPMPGINLFFTPDELFYTSFAVFDANQGAHFLEFYGKPSLAQPTTDGILLISESGLTWNKLPFTRKGWQSKTRPVETYGDFCKI